uniref:Short chain dehydrogenase/reductase family 16C, member 6 n=1 Tax=Nannospalax galili TaxID=1026970 RepID=A0A8C6R0N0_NANGA
MNALVDTAIFLGKFLYDFLESSVFKIIPKRKKNGAGEIVTGEGSGLGRLLAIHFALHGAILVHWDIHQKDNMETCRLIKEKGDVKVFAYKYDCSNRQEFYRVADHVREEVGDVTILINNEGKLFLDTPDRMVERSFIVNAISHFWICKAFLPAMIKANHGHLVCISSLAGLVISELTDYSSSKFAAIGLKSQVKTTIICPYFFQTGKFEGCTTRYPLLLPLLEQKVLKYPFSLLSSRIESPKVTTALGEYLGVGNCMASFRGKTKTKELQTETEKKHQ